MEKRLKHFIYIAQFCFVALISTAFYLQIYRGPYYKDLSQANRIRIIPLEASRGRILDSRGEILAGNRVSFNVVALPQELRDKDAVFEQTAEYLGVSPKFLKSKYKRNYYAPFAPVIIARDIDKEKALFLEELIPSIRGIAVRPSFFREYPNNEMASHTLGYVGEITREELDILRDYGYRMRDMVGRQGIEKSFDSYLRGVSGGKQIEIDNRGRFVRVLGNREPQPGRDITLTIDGRLQKKASQLLKGRIGAIIVLNVNSGAVLAIESSPGFDPNLFVRGDNSAIVKLLRSSNAPFLHRCIAGRYPPGSIFKLVVALAGLNEGVIEEKAYYECKGNFYLGDQRFRCWKREGHGYLNVTEAITQSCNVYFFKKGLQLGQERIEKYARLLGFGAETGIGLDNEYKGIVPNKIWKRQHIKAGWYEGDTVNFSIGQGFVIVTPIQIVRMIAAIANGGRLLTPFLVDKIGEVKVGSVKYKELGFSENSLSIVKKAMGQVVSTERGTGHNAYIKDIKMGAKTGTAQTSHKGKTHAWFAGFAPFDKPEIAFVAFLEHGGSGGDIPADIVKELVGFAKEQGII